MNTEKTYVCAICGKEHPTVQSRMTCEMNCLRKQGEEARKVAEAKKKSEQETRHAEVTKAIDNTYELLEAYIRDYKRYVYKGKYDKYDLFKHNALPHIEFFHDFLF